MADISNISLNSVERIEVLSGLQSIVYDSSAIGGVINIITKTNIKGPNSSFYYGSLNSWGVSGATSHKSDMTVLNLNISHDESDGISSASAKNSVNLEKDGYKNSSIAANLKWNFTDALTYSMFSQLTLKTFDMDRDGGPTNDDPNYEGRDEKILLKNEISLTSSEKLKHLLDLSFTNFKRSYQNNTDPLDSSTRDEDFNSKIIKISERNILKLNKENSMEFGLTTKYEEAKTYNFSNLNFDEYIKDHAVYLLHGMRNNKVSISEGIRYNFNEFSNDFITYKLLSTYKIKKIHTSLKASVGNGAKAPSLYQRYSSYGDRYLKNESSRSYELGFNSKISLFDFEYLFFKNNFKDLIDYDFVTSKYGNIVNSETYGYEAILKTSIGNSFAINLNYMRLISKDLTSGEYLLGRPEHKSNLIFNHVINYKIEYKFDLNHTGRRNYTNNNPSPSYALCNLSLFYKLNTNIKLNFTIKNILNKYYEEMPGYGTPGRTFLIKFNLYSN